MSNRERLANAFEVAKKEFDVERLLDPEDVDNDNPGKIGMPAYGSSGGNIRGSMKW